MLKTAARAWGYPEAEAETAFDPLVNMLLGACSAELEKISAEIHASRGRVTERLVQLLSPDVLTGPLPAHAIACGKPAEHATELSPSDQLYLTRRVAAATDTKEAQEKDIFFSPTGTFRLNRAAVRYMAAGNHLYGISKSAGKEIIAYGDTGKALPPSTLYLGIDEPGTSLHHTQFYFECRNEAERQLFYGELPSATWFAGDSQLAFAQGYNSGRISGEDLDLQALLHRNADVGSRLKKGINGLYRDCFITLLDEEGVTAGEQETPHSAAEIHSVFSGKDAQQVKKQPIRWIRIRFPQPVSNRLLQDVVCVMNAFPVMNRRLLEINHRLQDVINIIPLQTEDIFLDLEEVTDDEGKRLTVRSMQGEEEEAVALLFRNGGVGRFDERDAAAIIHYLLQLLRDESAAFSTIGNDFAANELTQLQQTMNRLEQRFHSLQLNRGQVPYLVIRNTAKKHWHSLFIQYWSTNGREANFLKAGTSLKMYNGGALDENDAVLVTATQGGRDKLGTTEAVLAYKSALLSKDRIVTAEDIKAFCRDRLGGRAERVMVEKGVMIPPGEKQGFRKTIDVTIDIRRDAYGEMLEHGEAAFWAENLEKLLEEKSAALWPYRVTLREKS